MLLTDSWQSAITSSKTEKHVHQFKKTIPKRHRHRFIGKGLFEHLLYEYKQSFYVLLLTLLDSYLMCQLDFYVETSYLTLYFMP